MGSGVRSVCLINESYLLNPPTVDELMNVETGPAVRALGPLLCQPPSDAEVAAELGAVRT